MSHLTSLSPGVPAEVKEKMFNPFFTISHYPSSARITNAVSAIGTFVYRVFISAGVAAGDRLGGGDRNTSCVWVFDGR